MEKIVSFKKWSKLLLAPFVTGEYSDIYIPDTDQYRLILYGQIKIPLRYNSCDNLIIQLSSQFRYIRFGEIMFRLSIFLT